MGVATSKSSSGPTAPKHALQDELDRLNKIVTAVVNEDNLFQNSEYNFLSQDVCNKYQVILESDLNKQLKLNIISIGESLLLIPRDGEQALLAKRNLKKDEICTRVANHYMKILYILCLIKYVYNVERYGDLSIAGILYRNISVTKDTFQLSYCKTTQKNLREAYGEAATYLDFSKLEGLKFFVEYFLEPKEAQVFIRTMKHVLLRKTKGTLRADFCELGAKRIADLEELYMNRYGKEDPSLVCKEPAAAPTQTQSGGSSLLRLQVDGENPIFDKDWCMGGPTTITIPTAEPDGKEAVKLYKTMRARCTRNIKSVEAILERLVEPKSSAQSWTLRDITKEELDSIIEDIKVKVKAFYLQSLMDFQDLLDKVKTFPKAIIV